MFHVNRLSVLVITASGLSLLGFRTSPRSINGSAQAPVTHDARANAACQVRGVWELVSLTVDGKDQPRPGFKQRKMLTDRYFMWIGQQARRDTLPLRTLVDTLRAYSIAGGGGTYTTTSTTYVEHIDLENDPSWIGTSFTATCRIEGDRWYHGFTVPNDTTKGPYHRFVEVWRRVE